MEKFQYNKYLDLKNRYNRIVNVISILRMIVFIIVIISFIIGSSNYFFNYLAFLFIALFIVLIFIHDKYYKLLDYYDKYIMIVNQYKDRINGKWKNFNDTGIEFANDLLTDLNIVGNNSLFQYINVCKTVGGRRKLISKLSNHSVNNKYINDSQELILELSNNINFLVDFQVNINNKVDSSIDFNEGLSYLNKKVGNKNIDLFLGILFSFLCLLFLFLGYLKIISYNYFYVMFIFNFLISYMYSFIYSREFISLTFVSSLYGKLYGVYSSILNRKFNSKKMTQIYNNMQDGYKSIRKLVFIDNLNNLKNNILSSFIFNGLFNINIIVMYLYSKFQLSNVNIIKKSIDDIYELEAMISLAGIGIIRDDVCIPSIDEKVVFDVKNIKHPLLDINKCVGNDFFCKNGVNIITGSNMGGKTSFIRTIGINLILMNAGTYVCADSFNSSIFEIFTSISIKDNIDKGVSTFYEELLRINKAIKYNEGKRIVLVDEIFKGTNYNDRIYGALNVIKKLNDDRTILFITTHDFELCEIDINNIFNYYVKEDYEGNNIKFDYKIRKGKCTSTNAKYLMSKLGIID